MALFEDTALYYSYNKRFDGYLTIATLICIGMAGFQVIWSFVQAASPSRIRSGNARKREVRYFLALALISLILVNSLRFQHVRLKIASWKEIKAHSDRLAEDAQEVFGRQEKSINVPGVKWATALTDAAKSVTDQVDSMVSTAGHMVPHNLAEATETAKSTGTAIAQAGKHGMDKAMKAHPPSGNEVKSAVRDGVVQGSKKAKAIKKGAEKKGKEVMEAGKKKGKQITDDSIAAVSESGQMAANQLSDLWYKGIKVSGEAVQSIPFPWLNDYLGPRSSIWDFWKSTIDQYRRFWWTQQWNTGYFTWAVFVGIECRHRGFTGGLAPSFVFLGYCFSLASMQSLFYALILMNPAHERRRPRWVPNQYLVALPALIELVILPRLPWICTLADKPRRIRVLNVLQGVLAFLPYLTADFVHRRLPSTRKLQAPDLLYSATALKIVWFGIAICCAMVHLSTTYSAYLETRASPTSSWLRSFGLGRLVRSTDEPDETHIARSAWSVLRALGDHAWINAVGWDVVFSSFSLALWAAVSSADVRSIIKCTIWPWIDETIEVAQAGADAAEPYVDAMRDGAENLYEASQPYLDAAKESAGNFQGVAEPYWERTKSAISSTKEQAREVLDNYGLDPEDLLERARNGMDLGLDQVQGLSKTGWEGINASIERLMENRDDEDEDEDEEYGAGGSGFTSNARATSGTGPPRRRGRGRQGAEDDEEEDDDWSEHRRKKSRSPVKKTRGKATGVTPEFDDLSTGARKRGVSKSPAPASGRQLSPTKRRSTRLASATSNGLRAANKGAKKAAKAVKRSSWWDSISSAQLPRELADGTEAAALSWVMFVLGGLGFASAGVFGADEIEG